MFKIGKNIALVVLVALTAGDAIADVNGFVGIGNPGYAADAATGYGYVDYSYRIGRTEVTISDFLASGISASGADFWNTGPHSVGTSAPAVNMTWHQAAQYCNYLTSGNVNTGAYTIVGGLVTAVTAHSGAAMDSLVAQHTVVYALPTENEWYKAAYFTGSGYSDYATGTNTPPANGIDAMYSTNTVWAVGSGLNFEQNGTKDLMGNVFEWLEESYDQDLTLDGSLEDMAFRGGGAQWPGGSGNPADDRLLRDKRWEGIDINAGFEDIGLRVVAIPEPGTLSLMSLSTVGLFVTRSVRRRKKAGKTLFPIGREHFCDTYATMEEWEARFNEVEGQSALAVVEESIQAKLTDVWAKVYAHYKLLDDTFWNYMVASHERRVARKKAFKSALKKNALRSFDAFLSLIMK